MIEKSCQMPRQEKISEREAIKRQVEQAQNTQDRVKKAIQVAAQKHEKKAGRGDRAFRRGRIDKLTGNSRQERSEKTKRRQCSQDEKQWDAAKDDLSQAIAKLELDSTLALPLAKTYVPAGKQVLCVEALSFGFSEHKNRLLHEFSMTLSGPERVAIMGDNGSGKSTLLKLITGSLRPEMGDILLGVEDIGYLDQKLEGVDQSRSVIENLQDCNPELSQTERYYYLAKFLFAGNMAQRIVASLSGGEQLRAQLLCALMAVKPPQLLILDEPSNHLDFASLESLESALNAYQGAILVVSHDQHFLDNIKVSRTVHL